MGHPLKLPTARAVNVHHYGAVLWVCASFWPVSGGVRGGDTSPGEEQMLPMHNKMQCVCGQLPSG